MDLNTIIFGGLAILSMAAFFYLGKMRASKAQRERDDRIDWTARKFSFRSCITIALGIFIAINLIENIGGSISFSNNKNKGAKVEIKIFRVT